MPVRKLLAILFGRPLRAEEGGLQNLGVLTGLSFIGLGALASAAYGPEAALTVLLPLGDAGIPHALPLMAVVVVVLAIVVASYWQTITAYPESGGAYPVTRRNLGVGAGLVAGAALFIDLVLNVAVGVSAGVGALVSAAPSLQPHTLALTLAALAVMTFLNLRGTRESGLVVLVPTILFLVGLFAVVAVAVNGALGSGGRPAPMPPADATLGPWLLARAFASGCASLTGIEAISNAVPVFREPRVARARRTLVLTAALLALLLVGITVSCLLLRVGAMPPGQAGYQSVLSRLTEQAFGRGVAYHVTIGAIVAVVCLSASTSFAAFPQLCRSLALDGFLPPSFARQGPRLVYTSGVLLLAALAAVLLVMFGGITDRLVPLFAIGAFLSFTMSQGSMVAHWRREKGRGHRLALALNAAGAITTAAALVVLVASKLLAGAWVTVILLAGLLVLFARTRARARALERETQPVGPLVGLDPLPEPPVVVVPLKRLDEVARKALHFALSIARDVQVVQVLATRELDADLAPLWRELVEEPCRRAGLPVPHLVVFRSSYRDVVDPLLEHVRRLAVVHPNRSIVVVIPEVVRRRWYHVLLQNHTATVLKAMLLIDADPRVIIANTPWYLGEERSAAHRGGGRIRPTT